MTINDELTLVGLDRSPAQLRFDDKSVLALVYLTDFGSRRRTAESEERARRLVACWNACVGMSTEDIESWAAENKRKRDALAADEAFNNRSIACTIRTEGGPEGGQPSRLEITGEFSTRRVIEAAIEVAKERRALVYFAIDGIEQQVCWTSDTETILALHDRQRDHRTLPDAEAGHSVLGVQQ
jgi:hypothetical protein